MDPIGIDVHKQASQICMLGEGGELIEERIRTAAERFADLLGSRPRGCILLEASTESEWVARCLEGLGHEVIGADPNFAPMYATRQRKVKTDRRAYPTQRGVGRYRGRGGAPSGGGATAEYAPNLPSAVLDWFTRTALNTERTFPNMKEGDLLVGAFSHGQVGYNRPFAGVGRYRGCLPGLYLCGASSHPGGNNTGLPGYNCAQVLLADLGLPAPWAPEPVEQILQRL